jgi:DNA repair protein RecO
MAFKTEAFVLRSRPFREADRIYDLFTPQEGVISVVLRSAARSRSKLAGHLMPFNKVRVMIGRGKMDHMAGVVVIENYGNLRGDLKSMSLACSIVELFLGDRSMGQKFVEFSLMEHIFTILNHQGISMNKKMILVRAFLWKYLSVAGWQPHFRSGKHPSNEGAMYMEHDHNKSVSVTSELFDFLQFIIQSDWPQLINLSIDKGLNREWLRISRIYYQSIFEKPSKSLKLFVYG